MIDRHLFFAALALAMSSTACSPSDPGSRSGLGFGGEGGNDPGAGGGGGTSGTKGRGGAGGGFLLDGGGGKSGGSGGVRGDACAAESRRAESLPIDLYIMFDQSASMTAQDAGGMTRWDAVTTAARQFIQAPESAGIGVGIQFFGRNVGNEDCNPATYTTAEVPIAPLPGNANALIGSLGRHAPSTETPTTAALTGAVTFARNWKNSNPTHTIAVLLVTDGVPETPLSSIIPGSSCVQNPQSIQATAQAAAQGAGNIPQIPTYVLGVGPNLANLNQIAAAGGTQKAYLFDGTQNVSQEVLNALNTIRGKVAIPCEIQIPQSGQNIDYDKVNVQFAPDGVNPQTIYGVRDASQCDPVNGGWYYDNLQQPTKIVLCDASCRVITTQLSGQLDVVLGCQTITGPPR